MELFAKFLLPLNLEIRRKKIIIGIAASLFAVAGLFGVNTVTQNANSDISLSGIAVMAEAQAESGATNYGYRSWNVWYSTKNGYDCQGIARSKVAGRC